MNVSLTFDSKGFSRDINILRVLLKKDGPTIVKDESRLFVRDAMKLTPPCGRHAITESWAEQRKIGMAAVERDISKLFPPLKEVKVITQHPRANEFFQRYIRARNKQAIRKMLSDFGINDLPIFDEATPALHKSARDSKGRVRRGAKFVVLDQRSVGRLIKQEQAQVGKGKAGFMRPALALGLKGVPNWISKHSSSPGHFIDGTKNTFTPFIELGNMVDYIQEPAARVGVMQAAMRNRRRSIRIRIEKLVKHYARK